MKQIYIIEDGSGNKKIGITENIERRVKQLKTDRAPIFRACFKSSKIKIPIAQASNLSWQYE